MPRGNRMGPLGMGPRTGRAAGYCAGFGMPGYLNPYPGRGMGMGFGRGRGWRNRFYATGVPGWSWFGGMAGDETIDSESEKRDLKNHLKVLQAECNAVKKRLSEIESAPEDSAAVVP